MFRGMRRLNDNDAAVRGEQTLHDVLHKRAAFCDTMFISMKEFIQAVWTKRSGHSVRRIVSQSDRSPRDGPKRRSV